MSGKGLFWIRMDENIKNIGDESGDLGERKKSLQSSKRKSRRFGIFGIFPYYIRLVIK